MHIRINFSLSYYKYIYSSDSQIILHNLNKTFKEEQNDINLKNEIILLNLFKLKFYLPSQRCTNDLQK